MKEKNKKLIRTLCSMKCAVILLIILALACTIGSFIPQGKETSYYLETYSEQAAGAILLFGLDDVFHCGWFIVLTLLLCAELLGCNVLRLSSLIRRTKHGFSAGKAVSSHREKAASVVGDPAELFQRMGFRKIRTEQIDGREVRYSVRNRAGLWGPWLCHLGMLVIIAGFGLGQMFKNEYTVYGVPGQTKTIGELNYELTIDDFSLKLREDDTVEQYTADITVTDTKAGEKISGSTSVNAPVSLFGMKFYQNSTGWAAGVTVYKGEEEIQEALLCNGEYLETEGKPELKLMLRGFYPDYARDEQGNPVTVSSRLDNPAYLYAVYYNDQVLGMNVLMDGEKITVDDYAFLFHDPRPYTLIQVKKDPFTWLAALGGLMTLISLILSFYMKPEELWAVQQEDGRWIVAGKGHRGADLFDEKLIKTCAEMAEKGEGGITG